MSAIEAYSELAHRDGRSIGVIKFSTRVRWCLVIREQSQIRHLAWFATEDDARAFCDVFTLQITDERDQPKGVGVHFEGSVADPQKVADEVLRLLRERGEQ